ncbi:MAG: TetR/AcrR family transcriptional regulator [Ruminococcus sp.]
MTSKDARIKRTRKCLEESLLRLMETKNIKDITVRELTERANINRSTFYLHYSDINDVIKSIEQNLLRGFYEKLAEDNRVRTIQEEVYHFMEVVVMFLQENRHTLLIICGKNGDNSFADALAGVTYRQTHLWFKNILGNNADPERARLAEIFFNTGCVALLENWVKNGEAINPTAVLRLLFQLVLTGAQGFVNNK